MVFTAVVLLGAFDLVRRFRYHRRTHALSACLLGSVLSLALIQSVQFFLQPDVSSNAHLMALGLLLVVVVWKLLFGPWEVETKVVILGTFLAWVILASLIGEGEERQLLYLLTTLIALIPALLWCTLFLRYHRERLSVILLLFFGGMLSTLPILFYDALVRHGVELQFFVFRVVPESFNRTSESFASGQLGGLLPVDATILTSIVSFCIVATIEELSKYWMVRRNGLPLARSIDDVLQFAIITAIGFAFAENVINPSYFLRFVQDALVYPTHPDLSTFTANVLGRSVLTGMVHIVSTGVIGYFLGLAAFAPDVLRERQAAGVHFPLLRAISTLCQQPMERIFRVVMIVEGIAAGIGLHMCFNVLVTLPDILPGNPRTFAELGGAWSILGSVPLLLPPALFYVVGGFWLLTGLFLQQENQREHARAVAS
jgi:RsiW-degrading membrane proteinase PrsW (M82 family)